MQPRALDVPEIVGLICKHVHLDTYERVLDPPLVLGQSRSCATTSLHHLALVNRLFHAEVTPYLYRDISIGIPASFEGLLHTIGVLDDAESTEMVVQEPRTSVEPVRQGRRISNAMTLAAANANAAGAATITTTFEERQGLLTPPASREPSRDRDRDSDEDAHTTRTVKFAGPPGIVVDTTLSFPSAPPPDFFMPLCASPNSLSSLPPSATQAQFATPWRESNPAFHTESITFERFRAHGLRRTVKEGSRQRFVTPVRVLQILRGTRAQGELREGRIASRNHDVETRTIGKLKAVGLTEYIDSALTDAVLEEILLRGGTSTSHDVSSSVLHGTRLALATQPIESVDFCGCVSRTYVEALATLSDRYSLELPLGFPAEEDATSPIRTTFPHVRRLGLYNVLISASLFSSFVVAFPNLTHLDLGGTRTNPSLLYRLGRSTTLHLKSLSLSRCQSLTSESIRDFFVASVPTVLAGLRELNLHYDATSAMPLTRAHFREMLESAPCFLAGQFRYLDVSTAPLDDALLEDCFSAQPELVDLGIANCPRISWRGLTQFIAAKALKIEVIELRGSCRQPLLPTSPTGGTSVGGAGPARRNETILNTIMGLSQFLLNPSRYSKSAQQAAGASASALPYSLRAIELDEKALEALEDAGAHQDWRVCWGKGSRGWYFNIGVAPTTDPLTGERVLTRLPAASRPASRYVNTAVVPSTGKRGEIGVDLNDPRRVRLIELSKKSKSGGYNFGWHARKMAVLSGDGLLGREHGLYNYHSFS